MSSIRIKGNKLALSFGGVDVWADVTAVTLENTDKDGGLTTFEDAAGTPSRQYLVKGTAIQSLQTSSFWRYAWANSGQTVAFRYAPKGNQTASADEPHFLGQVKIGPRPTVGGEAGTSNEFSFDFEWRVDGDPTMDEGIDGVPVISSITPTGQGAGEQVVITGTRLSGATDVKFGITSADNLIVVSDTTLAVIVPAGTGVKAVTVHAGAKTSAPVDYTVAA
ncbi:IPT/TIG domain-containing protein [Leucobacter sp. W1153]|uniref:IPT/TIG domain-containing protein n=1 Tax=Leucobacter sp. W1153 TaxID=3439064 RepID=UPI003F2DB81C